MDNQFDYDVIIAGGGPAGASAATHLAMRGARVLLAEQKKFPREKLCGEFISPECALHFERLGVIDRMLAASPAHLNETVFYARNGKSVCVPSQWFGANGSALGLSRAEMDERLLRRAGEAGVTVLEEAQVGDLLFEKAEVRGVGLKNAGTQISYHAPVTIDATGRARSLARRVGPHRSKPNRAPLVAFKAHLEDARVAPGACEIYFYRGGYGGLSSIEDGRSNLCFIASARDVRACAADPERAMREIVCQNARAAYALTNARARAMARCYAREFWPASNRARERFADNWRCGILHRSFYRQRHADGAGEWRACCGDHRRSFGCHPQRLRIRRIERAVSSSLRKKIRFTFADLLVDAPGRVCARPG